MTQYKLFFIMTLCSPIIIYCMNEIDLNNDKKIIIKLKSSFKDESTCSLCSKKNTCMKQHLKTHFVKITKTLLESKDTSYELLQKLMGMYFRKYCAAINNAINNESISSEFNKIFHHNKSNCLLCEKTTKSSTCYKGSNFCSDLIITLLKKADKNKPLNNLLLKALINMESCGRSKFLRGINTIDLREAIRQHNITISDKIFKDCSNNTDFTEIYDQIKNATDIDSDPEKTESEEDLDSGKE